MLASLVAHTAQVYSLSSLVNLLSSFPSSSLNEIHVQWFAGLRGAVAFVCALAFPQRQIDESRGYVITTTAAMAILICYISPFERPTDLRQHVGPLSFFAH